MVWFTGKRRLALFPAGAIVKDLHHHESLTCREQDLNEDEDFTTIINEERNFLELKESIKIMKSQRSEMERNKLKEDGKRIGTDEIIKQKYKN